ncbi:MAG: alpha/beta hydrolase [Chloroflexota bacterium]
MSRKWIITLAVLAALLAVYFFPVLPQPFDELYASVDPARAGALQAFRSSHPPKTLAVEGRDWEYISAGNGERTILFLHGMTGAADIWWQQISHFEPDFRIIAVTYPALGTLAKMEQGVLGILKAEGVDQFYLVGTSLGGYFAQYLAGRHPDRVLGAVFSNTFPPNDLILEKNGTIGSLIPYLPEWAVLGVLKGSFRDSIYPTSGNDELTLAFLNEIAAGRMSKAQVAGRYACVVEKFDAANLSLPVLIIEADNDPLVEETLREQLKETYPSAQFHTFSGVGHFIYLNRPDEYNRVLEDFFE